MSDSVVEEVRSRADLVDIAGEHMSLKRVGKSVRGPCPLHDGDDPNFSIDPNRQIFKCFVCGEGGDVFSFVMKHLGLSFPEAVRYVGKRVGVEVPEEDEEREDPHSRVREAVAFAEEWFARQLLESEAGEAARKYLEGRGMTLDDAGEYAVGYAPDSWRDLREAAGKHGFEDELLLEAGLLSTSERADEPYDRFRNRLVFSIRDLRDRPIGFGGRTLSGDDETPKYINSPDSPIFRKGRTLYALNWARHAVRKEGRALVVEGFTDALSLHVRGRQTAVAPLGTAMTERQAEILGRYAEKAFLLYDSDRPGLRATFKAADNLLARGVHPMVVTLPPEQDPDSLVREEGMEALDQCIRDAVDVLERKLQILEQKGYLESIEGRRRAIDGLLSTLRAPEDPALRDIYLDRAAERTGVRRATLETEVAREREAARRRGRRRPRRRPEGEDEEPARRGGRAAERTFLLLVLRDEDGELLEEAAGEGLRPEHFEDPGFRGLYASLLRLAGDVPREEWPGELDPERRELFHRLEADETELADPDGIFRSTLYRLKNRPRLRRLREIDRELTVADEERAMELIEEKQELASELREEEVPLSFLHRWMAEGEPGDEGQQADPA